MDTEAVDSHLGRLAVEPRRASAVIIEHPGAEPRVGSATLPRLTPGSTLIKVMAAPLNPLDLLIASGNFHSARHDKPYVPGSECVGIVVQSERLPVGTWVYAQCYPSPDTVGAFATHTVVRDEEMLTLPSGIDPITAAAVGNSGTAAFMPLIQSAALQAGETVLILGATGAVGQIAIQIASRFGAGRVVGVARNRAALQGLLSLGADSVVDLREDESETQLAQRLSDAAGLVDIVLDGLYGVPLQAALRVCAPRARVVNVGNLSAPTAQIPAGLLRGKQISLTGFAGLHTPLQKKQAALTWLWSAIGDSQLQVPVREVSFEELPQAWLSQAASPHTKIVLRPGTEPNG